MAAGAFGAEAGYRQLPDQLIGRASKVSATLPGSRSGGERTSACAGIFLPKIPLDIHRLLGRGARSRYFVSNPASIRLRTDSTLPSSEVTETLAERARSLR